MHYWFDLCHLQDSPVLGFLVPDCAYLSQPDIVTGSTAKDIFCRLECADT